MTKCQVGTFFTCLTTDSQMHTIGKAINPFCKSSSILEKKSMYTHFSNSILLDFHYVQRQMNGLTRLQPFKLNHQEIQQVDI